MKVKLTNWQLQELGTTKMVSANVPGDITKSLYDAGEIEDPFFGLNHLKLKEQVLDKDYIYKTVFTLACLNNDDEDLVISFDGVDLFSEIYLNGVLLGKTENMFKRYEFNINNVAKVGENKLEVRMFSTTKYMDTLDTKDYFGVFNVPRILLRKEQCCFGWDWSPNIPGYGIWGDVCVYTESKEKLTDVYYHANCNGIATFFINTNYSVRSYYDNNGNLIERESKHEDVFRVSLTNKPNGDFSDAEVKEIPVDGCRAFVPFERKDFEIWWPVGYGNQPLYSYKVELVRDGKVISEKTGRIAFRSVELDQSPIDDKFLRYTLKINGKTIYMKGSNWVPVDCFTGCVTKEKYEKLISQAVAGNINTLRIWGGGIYEKDVFYDLCDEMGVMVWQDMMFACADIPEDNADFVKNASEELEYQVKRLRNHPSLVYWCGGNEKTGSAGALISRGDWFVNVIIRGIVEHFDGTRPYAKQSPCSWTDTANDLTSGESHKNSFEPTIRMGFGTYRERVTESTASLVSESALMGPHSRQTFEKIFPKEKLWPINEYWEDRLMENPYAAVKLPFAELECKFAKELYGDLKNLDDFIAKGMTMHAEVVKCECEYQRANKKYSSGWLNWMYSEIWPSGTWAVIDYYTEPKQAYYQMKKSFEPVLMSFFYRQDGKTVLFGVNDTLTGKKVAFTYGQKDMQGKVLWSETGETVLSTEDAFMLAIERDIAVRNTYLFVSYTVDGKNTTTLYSYDFWSSAQIQSDYTVELKQVDEYTIHATVKANSLAKSVFITLPENYKCNYSDNYIDVEAGEEKTVVITSKEKIAVSEVRVSDLASEK